MVGFVRSSATPIHHFLPEAEHGKTGTGKEADRIIRYMEEVAETCRIPVALEKVAQRIVIALRQEAEKYTAVGATPKIAMSALQFTRVIDPGNQLPGYEGVWRNSRNARCGTLTFNTDNSFFAEYDLFCPHPRDTRWFVESVTAWGRDETLRCEVKLIPSMEK